MSLKKRVAWIDPSGKVHTILASDMDDAVIQIAALRKALGFPEPTTDTIMAAVELEPGTAVGKAVVSIKDLPEEMQKTFNDGLSNTLEKVVKKKLD